jgi:large subunit ribosomal protein L17
MRHMRAGRKLAVDSQHRTALRRNLARSLLLHGRITTTLAKAKATRPYVEKLVTRARRAAELKDGDRASYIHQLRVLRQEIPERKVLSLLVNQIAPLCKERPGGYTRILRHAKSQLGDNAPLAILEFVDRPTEAATTEVKEGDAKEPAPKKPARKAKAAGKAGAKARSTKAAGAS